MILGSDGIVIGCYKGRYHTPKQSREITGYETGAAALAVPLCRGQGLRSYKEHSNGPNCGRCAPSAADVLSRCGAENLLGSRGP